MGHWSAACSRGKQSGTKRAQDPEQREKPKDQQCLVRSPGSKVINWWAKKGEKEKHAPACWRHLEFTGPLICYPN